MPSTRHTISLSTKAGEQLETVKKYTEAETTTEVFRDALRLAHQIMEAEKRGFRVEIINPSDPSAQKTIICIGSKVAG